MDQGPGTTREVKTSRRVEQGDATRAELLTAARRLFGQRGYAQTSLADIVDEAGVTKGALYHHFDSKRDAFMRVFEQVQDEIGTRSFVVHLDHEGTDGTPPAIRELSEETNDQVWAHLVHGCRTYIESHLAPQVQRIVLFDGRAVLPWEDWHRIHGEHSGVLLRADLRRAMRRGIVAPLPLPTLATMLAGALIEGALWAAQAEDPSTAVEEAMTVVERLLAGLRAE